ncbi:MAG: site-2 protease family protein [Chloroflexi bacterium]|nr:site-2 protease family protein [Chloroflexota bacterium]
MNADAAAPAPEIERAEVVWLQRLAAPHLDIREVTAGALDGRAIRLSGELLSPPDVLYAALAGPLRERGRTLLLRREDGQATLLAVQGVVRPQENNRWLPAVLAVLTFASMVFTYAIMHSSSEAITWAGILAGLGDALAFSVSLLAILVTHELGHYLTARRFGVAVSLPFLIPLPMSLLGTMGAIIRMKDIPPSRKALLYIGAAGPLAGLAVGVPILALGIALSEVTTLPSGPGYMLEGNSLLYGALKFVIKGQWLPSATHDIMLHPVALAGWAGVLITALNLIPAGQLDGGHVASALLGQRARTLTWLILAALLLLGLLWQGWLLWAVLVYLSSRAQAQPLDDLTTLKPGEMRLAVALFLLALLTFTPIPIRLL